MPFTEVLIWPTFMWKSMKVIAAKHARSGKFKATRERRTMACIAKKSQRAQAREGADLKFVQTTCDKHKHQLSENGQIALKSNSFAIKKACILIGFYVTGRIPCRAFWGRKNPIFERFSHLQGRMRKNITT